MIHAQRRPGPEPQRHPGSWPGRGRRRARSTKAGAGAPATPGELARTRPTACSLNEGRGRSPSDTADGSLGFRDRRTAQRRPGPEPQRHPSCWDIPSIRPIRSTKAGAGAPATPPVPSHYRKHRYRAQRRPGPEPQRHHALALLKTHAVVARSTKAGAGAPATLCGRCPSWHRWQLRSTKAGAGAHR